MAEKKVITKPIDYAVLNQLSTDFETRFAPQTELSAEQAFWSRYSVQPEEPNLSASTTIVEVPKELPKVSLVNSSLKKLKFHLASFDMVVKERTTATAITEGTWGFEHTKACFRDDIIPFVKALKELFNLFDQLLIDELKEIETLNIELDHRVTKLVAENEHLKQTYKQLYDSIKPLRVRSKEQCDDLIKQVNLKSAEISDLNASLQDKVLVITALKESLSKHKGKDVVNEAIPLHSIDHELLKIDVAPLPLKLRKNRTVHTDYIRHTQEEAATLRGIVERSKLVAVTQKNRNKQIRLTEQIHKSGKTTVKTTPSTNVVSNTPVLSSIGVNLLSSASGSKSQDNTKNDRIQRTPRKAKKNKLEEHLRTVRPSLNKKSVVDTKATSSVTNSMSNVNSDLKCASCYGCLFFDNHDACVVAYINYVNASIKSKSFKKPVKRRIWQPTGKMLTTVGHIWKPTGQTFTLVGNVCPLTRLAMTTIVPPREPIPIVSNTDKPVITLLINFVQKFLGTVKFGNDHVAKIMGYGDYQIGNVTISRVYYVEGLGHNLFFVGQFCDSDLEVAFRQHTCFIHNLDGVDLLTGSRGNNLYTPSLQDMMASSPICLLSKASKTKSWLWHHRLSHLNFGVINHLARQGLVRGLPKLKFKKYHLCSACASTPTETATRSAGRSTQGSRSRQASTSESAFVEEPMQTTSQMEEPSHPEFDTGADDQPIVQSSQHPEWFSQPQKPPTLDRDWNKTLPAVHESIEPWIRELAKQADTRSSFNELMDTPLDFSNFIMNWLRVDTLTLELLAGPTYDLMKGSCKSLIELEYHLEEVYKDTTDQFY
nr:integrase, catalytic region, zinc finger, CCHC-type, peptidase aspartic, catalytic [Tanacetum cinerariifolium]